MSTRATTVTLLLVSLALAGCAGRSAGSNSPGGEPAVAQTAPPQVTIFLVRHAETIYPPPADEPRNPPLNAMGQDRADALARLLEPAGIERILSSDYHRTRETTAPLAEALGLEVELYDPGNLAELAEALLATPGRTLVAGHSNTTPELVGLLGGAPGEPIDESIEFDRLYVLTGNRDAGLTTVVLRYGAPVLENWRELATQRRQSVTP